MSWDTPPTNAEHVFQFARNSQPHYQQMRGLVKYPRDGNFTTSVALTAAAIANSAYREIRQSQGAEYSPQDLLGAAVMFLDWDGDE